MSVFNSLSNDNHELIVHCCDATVGLKAIIAIHNTHRGPALGGCRMWDYENEEDALEDVLRLSKGMTYKSALANLKLGGGKSVIIGDKKKIKTPELLKSFARFVHKLGGHYITAEDVATNLEDMDLIRQITPYAVGTTSGGSGDPSPATAYGVFNGIKAARLYKFGNTNLTGIKVAVQGVGHVGHPLCDMLHKAGAKLYITDISERKIKEVADLYGATPLDLEDIYDANVDVFSPCALGATINQETIPRLKASIVVGSANNQLAIDEDGILLKEHGILYAPDYVVNAGGVINVSYELTGYEHSKAYAHIDGIYDTLLEIFDTADKENIATNYAADRVAERRFHTDKSAA